MPRCWRNKSERLKIMNFFDAIRLQYSLTISPVKYSVASVVKCRKDKNFQTNRTFKPTPKRKLTNNVPIINRWCDRDTWFGESWELQDSVREIFFERRSDFLVGSCLELKSCFTIDGGTVVWSCCSIISCCVSSEHILTLMCASHFELSRRKYDLRLKIESLAYLQRMSIYLCSITASGQATETNAREITPKRTHEKVNTYCIRKSTWSTNIYFICMLIQPHHHFQKMNNWVVDL